MSLYTAFPTSSTFRTRGAYPRAAIVNHTAVPGNNCRFALKGMMRRTCKYGCLIKLQKFFGVTTIATFMNRSEKKPPRLPSSQARPQSSEKIGLASCVVREQSHEPWNEYVVQDDPTKTLRVKTVLTDVLHYPDFDTPVGDPIVEALRDPRISVTTTLPPNPGPRSIRRRRLPRTPSKTAIGRIRALYSPDGTRSRFGGTR